MSIFLCGRMFRNEEGRLGMLVELVSMERLLDSTRVMANAMRIAMCRQLNIDDTAFPVEEDRDEEGDVDLGPLFNQPESAPDAVDNVS
jgi:hypothetical protein